MSQHQKGQMTIIMLFIAAAAFILFAVSMNWGRIAMIKTQVTISANTAASGYASMIGSYAQSVKENQLGGKWKKCKYTPMLESLLTALVMAIIIVAAVVITAATGGAGAAMGPIMTSIVVGASIGLVASVATAIIQTTAINPMITSAWKKWQKNLDVPDQFMEQGIQTMLTSATSDMVMIPDAWDLDLDGKTATDPSSPEKVSRFSYYYTMRQNVASKKVSHHMKELQEVLRTLMIDLGMLSTEPPLSCRTEEGDLKPYCDPCCVAPDSRPAHCSTGLSEVPVVPDACLAAAECDTASPATCYVYNPNYPNQQNLPSDRIYKALGTDDMTPFYTNETASATLGAEQIHVGAQASQGSFFELLWLLKDTAPAVSSLSTASLDATVPACHWLARESGTTCDPAEDGLYQSDLGGQLELGVPCAGDACLVGRFNDSITDPSSVHARQIDIVGNVPGMDPVSSACAKLAGDPVPIPAGLSSYGYTPPPSSPWWQPGADRQSDELFGEPVKLANADLSGIDSHCVDSDSDDEDTDNPCVCANIAHKEWWRDDAIDAMADAMENLSRLGGGIVNADDEALQLYANTIQTWGPSLAQALLTLYHPFNTTWSSSEDDIAEEWRDPKWWGADVVFNKTLEGTTLHAMLKRVNEYYSSSWTGTLDGWLDGSYKNDSAWCVPSDENELSADEKSYIRQGEDPATVPWGNLEHVIRCLDYGTNQPRIKYQACSTALSAIADPLRCTMAPFEENGACYDLPRSPLTGFDPNYCKTHTGFVPEEYATQLTDSMDLMRAQEPKMAKRAEYLRRLQSRIQTVKGRFEAAIVALERPCNALPDNMTLADSNCDLDSDPYDQYKCCKTPAEPRIYNAMQWLDEMMEAPTEAKPILGNEVVYAWFGEPVKGLSRTINGADLGYLHIVKVQGSIPQRRNIPGLPPGFDGEKLPWIDTYIKGHWWTLNQKRCYELKAYSGSVGARVIRYDEDHVEPLKFLSGLPLWKILYHNPKGPADEVNVDSFYTTCMMEHKKRTLDASGKNYIYSPDPFADQSQYYPLRHAVMLSKEYDSWESNNSACWDLANRILKKGVVSQSCATFNAKDNVIKFKSCP